MKTAGRLGLGLGMIALLALAAGCGDDEKPTAPTTKATGDLDDPEFRRVENTLSAAVEYGEMLLNNTWYVIGQVGDSTPGVADDGRPTRQPFTPSSEGDSTLLVYHSASQYWYFFAQEIMAQMTDTLTITLRDSVQFLQATGPVQWPDSALLTGINMGGRLSLVLTNGDSAAAAHVLAVMGQLSSGGDVTINGTQDFLVDSHHGADSCEVFADVHATATDIEMNLASNQSGGCPYGGVLWYRGNFDIACTGDPAVDFADVFTITGTFQGNNTIAYVVENSTTRWTFTETCGDSI